MKTFKELREELNASDELNEGIVSKLFPWTTGLIDKGLHKILDQIEKMTDKHVGLVQKSSIPSAGKDRGNEFVKFKKEAEDFHRKAKKQWTWSSKEIESGFQYYGSGKIPDDKVKLVKRVQADIQKIIAMHTKLESMMQTTGNSPTYQRTMEKLESDTKRVFKEIADSGIGASGGKYRAMQGMDNLKKAKKMTHKEPRQISPTKFRAYANMGESLTAEERKFVESLNNMSEGDYGKKKIKTEGGYGKINATYGKKAKEEELSPKQKKIDKNKNGKIDGSDLQSLRKEGADDYEDHMMYDPKTGKGRMTTSYEDHLDLKDKGWGHEKPTKESYGKMNASKMSSKEKAKARALAKADKDAQPKDKVSLKKAPWDKKMKEDFVKQMNIIVEGGELEQSIEESMSPKQIDMLKKSYESLRGKRISVENGMKLSKKLEKLDKESAIAVAKADIPFMSNLAINKLIMNFGMSGADIKKAMKESVELGESAGDMEKAAAELEAYAKKNGGMDKNTFMRVANLLKTGHPDKLKSYVNNMDTDPREYVAMLLKKHIGKKSTEKMMDIKFRGESISWEDAETLRAAGVKLDEISSDMKKRYNKAALKDRDQQKNTLKRADDVGSKVVDGAVTDKASPSQTNSRCAKLDKIKQKANRKLTNRRKGLATPGKGSTTKVKDYFGMAEEISGTGYELYHKTLGSAIDTAITHAKLKFGIDITPDERMDVVGMGPRKPSNGKTNTYRLMGNKGKAIQVQVYNRGGSRPYELNMYKE